tara:strand:+ start:11734 stop:13581 length:1848 start_codon:yes stop_codon:yes gene_type:complete
MANIIGGWASAAQRGRQAAKQEQQNDMRIAQMEAQEKMYNMQNSALYKNSLDLIHAQSNELSKHYRPKDAEDMRKVAMDAENELKLKLEGFGDDPAAFLRAGGIQHLTDYRDAILNSDKARIIRANHGNLNKYLDLMKENPNLVSKADMEGFEKWKDSTNDAFIFHGQLKDYKRPENIEGFESLGHAYLSGENRMENFNNALYNYNVEQGRMKQGSANAILGFNDVTEDEIINFINDSESPMVMSQNYKDQLRGYNATSKKASQQILNANENMNRGYTGDWGGFWEEEANQNALYNLKQRTQMGDFVQMNKGNNVYSARMFRGSESKLVSSIFGMSEKDYSGTLSRTQINNMLRSGEIQMYDGDGNSLTRAEGFSSGGYGKSFDVEGINYAFEVQTDRENNKSKLLTYEDIQTDGEGSELFKNRAKDGQVIIALKDEDWYNEDDYVYIKLDMSQGLMADKFDKAVGEMDFRSKQVAETTPSNQFAYTPGKSFSFTGNNPQNAILSLHNGLDMSMKKIGINEYDPIAYATVMTHSLSNMEDEVSPENFVNLLTTNNNPVMVEARNKIKEGDVDGYISTFIENGAMSESEGKKLRKDIQAILRGYTVVGEMFENKKS